MSEKAVVTLLIKSGSTADPQRKEGLAFVSAQSVCYANQKMSPERWKDELEFLDVSLQIEVGADATVFQAEAPSSNLEALLSLLANVIIRPVFAEDRVNRIKGEVVNSVKSVVSSANFEERTERYFRECVHAGTPCAHAVQGNDASVARLDMSDIEAFHRTHYLPNNAALIVIGGPPMSRLGALVREKFGSWTKKELPPLEPATSSRPISNMIKVIDQKGLDDIVVVMGHPGPSRQAPDSLALRAVSILLGGTQPSSRLEKLFQSRNIAYRSLRAESWFGRSCGHFQVRARVPLMSLQPVLQIIPQAIEALKSEPASEAELAQVKAQILVKHNESLRSGSQLARLVTEIELYDLAKDFPTAFPSRVERLSPERLQEAAKSYLSSSRMMIIVTGDAEQIRQALQGVGSIEVVEVPPPTPYMRGSRYD